jgi:hypothetical protein
MEDQALGQANYPYIVLIATAFVSLIIMWLGFKLV